MSQKSSSSSHGVSFGVAGLMVTLGIVYGDIGTSPLYVFKAILLGMREGGAIQNEYIYGAISCIIWTLTLQTTLKYVVLTLRADNNGEGGIFSLFALIRRKAKWAYILAILGGSTLLADGIITPSITVVSAIEGLKILDPNIMVVPIAIGIIAAIFFMQRFGTSVLGKSFGPIMFFWFSMLLILGFSSMIKHTEVLKSFNPYYAYKLLSEFPGGFLLLGAVFLCTTGAEALYSDLGHCGVKNIRISWIFVKLTLIINYLGQGAWIISNKANITPDTNPFFELMPQWFLLSGIIVSTAAAIIASQALISGSFTLIGEAISLDFWPKVKINYPTTVKGQLYIPSINSFLFVSCFFVVIYFKESSKMEAAYGLSITFTMLMTTLLLSLYLVLKRVNKILILFLILTYLTIEGSFLIANLNKFMHGGYVTIFIAGILFLVMYIWYNGRKIKHRFTEFQDLDNYLPIIRDVSRDATIPKYATNLVYLTRANHHSQLEQKILYSILNKQPKRADIYWFLHVHVVDEPYKMEYKVKELIDGTMFRIDFIIGFRVQPRLNYFFRQVCDEMVKNKEVDLTSRYYSLKKNGYLGDFKFVIIDRIQNYDFDFNATEQMIMDIYSILKVIGISEIRAYGLDTSNVIIEKVPLLMPIDNGPKLNRL